MLQVQRRRSDGWPRDRCMCRASRRWHGQIVFRLYYILISFYKSIFCYSLFVHRPDSLFRVQKRFWVSGDRSLSEGSAGDRPRGPRQGGRPGPASCRLQRSQQCRMPTGTAILDRVFPAVKIGRFFNIFWPYPLLPSVRS